MKDHLVKKIKRGKASIEIFQLVYVTMLSVSIGLVSVSSLSSFLKILMILLVTVWLFNLCFLNAQFQNLLVGLAIKISNDKMKI